MGTDVQCESTIIIVSFLIKMLCLVVASMEYGWQFVVHMFGMSPPPLQCRQPWCGLPLFVSLLLPWLRRVEVQWGCLESSLLSSATAPQVVRLVSICDWNSLHDWHCSSSIRMELTELYKPGFAFRVVRVVKYMCSHLSSIEPHWGHTSLVGVVGEGKQPWVNVPMNVVI